MNRDNPYRGNLFNVLKPRDPDIIRDEMARAWEDDRVAFALKRLGLGKQQRAMRKAAVSRVGIPVLRFDHFNEIYPTFPMTLGCNNLKSLGRPLHLLDKAILPEWFRNFRNLPFVRVFEEFYDQLGLVVELRPVGLIFPRKGLAQGLVIHTGAPDQFVGPKVGYFCYRGGGKRPLDLVVQSFMSLLDKIYSHGRGWKPDPQS